MQNSKFKINFPFSAFRLLQSSSEFFDHYGFPLGEVACDNVLASLANQPQVEACVVQRCYLRSQHLATYYEVVKIRLRVLMIHEGCSVRVYRRKIVLPLLVADIDCTLTRKQLPVTTIAGRHYAIEHINTSRNTLQDVYW